MGIRRSSGYLHAGLGSALIAERDLVASLGVHPADYTRPAMFGAMWVNAGLVDVNAWVAPSARATDPSDDHLRRTPYPSRRVIAGTPLSSV